MKPSFRFPILFLILLSFTTPQIFAEGEPNFALRKNIEWVEAELFLGSFGLMYTQSPDYFDHHSVSCRPIIDRNHFTVRKFLMKEKAYVDSYYFGLTAYKDSLKQPGTCTIDPVLGSLEPKNGVGPTFGYRWVWEKGWEFDLGLRAGWVAVGFAF